MTHAETVRAMTDGEREAFFYAIGATLFKAPPIVEALGHNNLFDSLRDYVRLPENVPTGDAERIRDLAMRYVMDVADAATSGRYKASDGLSGVQRLVRKWHDGETTEISAVEAFGRKK